MAQLTRDLALELAGVVLDPVLVGAHHVDNQLAIPLAYSRARAVCCSTTKRALPLIIAL